MRTCLKGALLSPLLAWALLLTPGTAAADVLHLRSGDFIRGRILQENDREVRLQVPSGNVSILRKDITRIEREPEEVYLLRQGEDLLKRGSYVAAGDHFSRLLRLQPDSKEAAAGLARARKGEGDTLRDARLLEEAKEAYESALEADPHMEEALQMREHVEKVMALVASLREKAGALASTRDFAGAAEALEEALDLDPAGWADEAPKLGDLHRRGGDQLYRSGKFSLAAEAYDRALRADPSLVGKVLEARIYAHLQEAHEKIEAGDLAGARRIVGGIRFLAPYHPRVLYAGGRIDQLEEKLIAARDAYLRVLGESPAGEESVDLAAMAARARESLGPPPVPGPVERPKVEEGTRWSDMKLGPIRLHHKEPEIARDVALAIEYYLDVLPPHISPLPRPNPIYFDVWIHEDHDEFVDAGGRGRAILRMDTRTGSVPVKTLLIDGTSPEALPGDLPREMGRLLHLACQSFRRVHPPWVEEGIAARCEPVYRRLHYLDQVADAYRRGEGDPVHRLLRGARVTSESDRARAYALVEYLVQQRGLRHFSEAIDDLPQYPLARFLTKRYGVESRFGIDPLRQLSRDLRGWILARSSLREEAE